MLHPRRWRPTLHRPLPSPLHRRSAQPPRHKQRPRRDRPQRRGGRQVLPTPQPASTTTVRRSRPMSSSPHRRRPVAETPRRPPCRLPLRPRLDRRRSLPGTHPRWLALCPVAAAARSPPQPLRRPPARGAPERSNSKGCRHHNWRSKSAAPGRSRSARRRASRSSFATSAAPSPTTSSSATRCHSVRRWSPRPPLPRRHPHRGSPTHPAPRAISSGNSARSLPEGRHAWPST